MAHEDDDFTRWKDEVEALAPDAGAVTSVDGQTGAVALSGTYVPLAGDQTVTDVKDFTGDLRYKGGTVARVKEGPLSLLDPRVNADNTGFADVSAAVATAKTLLPARGGEMEAPPGLYLLTGGVELAANQMLRGHGFTSASGVPARAATCFVKQGNFDAFTLNAACALRNLQVDGAAGNLGDGVYVKGGRSLIEDVMVSSHGGVGIRFGGKVAGLNANLWRARNVLAVANGSHGVYVHSLTASPDANRGLIEGLDTRSNGGDGIRIENSIDCDIHGIHAASNVGQGIRLLSGATGHWFYSPYTELNTAGDALIDSGANRNVLLGCRSGTLAEGYVDNGFGNLILGRDGNTARFTWQNRMDFRKVDITDETISGCWEFRQNATTRALEVVFVDSSATTSDVNWLTEAAGGSVRHRFGPITYGVVSAFKSAAYQPVLTDAGLVIEVSNAAAVALTIPLDATVNFPLQTIIDVVQAGAGKVTITPEAGVTLRSEGGLRSTAAQWGQVRLRKRAANDWHISGRTIA